jgi:hypothetical protein
MRTRAITANATPNTAGRNAHAGCRTSTWVRIAPIIRPMRPMRPSAAQAASRGMSRPMAPAASTAPVTYRNH